VTLLRSIADETTSSSTLEDLSVTLIGSTADEKTSSSTLEDSSFAGQTPRLRRHPRRHRP
jgi:hypothetical protein